MKQIEQEVIRDTGVALPLSFNYNDGKIAEKGTLEIATLSRLSLYVLQLIICL